MPLIIHFRWEWIMNDKEKLEAIKKIIDIYDMIELDYTSLGEDVKKIKKILDESWRLVLQLGIWNHFFRYSGSFKKSEHRSITTEFKKDQIPYNKGKK